MGEFFEALLTVAARSVVRHAVVGVLTGGVGNIFLAIGDAMDLHDTLDAVDIAQSSSNGGGGGGVHFGSGLGSDGLYHNDITGQSFVSQSDWIANNQAAALVPK